jgi:hypothetical protein
MDEGDTSTFIEHTMLLLSLEEAGVHKPENHSSEKASGAVVRP